MGTEPFNSQQPDCNTFEAVTDDLERRTYLDEQVGRVELPRMIEMTAAITRACSQFSAV